MRASACRVNSHAIELTCHGVVMAMGLRLPLVSALSVTLTRGDPVQPRHGRRSGGVHADATNGRVKRDDGASPHAPGGHRAFHLARSPYGQKPGPWRGRHA